MANSNVLYYEPNWTQALMTDDGEQIVEIAPPLEDYCIVVDLEVEVPSRPIEGQVKSDSSTILLRYASKKGGKGSVSFMEGKKDGNESYLSTDAMEYGTFTDIEQISGTTTNEMFGINSINIEYNNYSVPVVTIEFTDIRGMSLFAVEEFRHNKAQNGVQFVANSDITGSFFKSFFTFPYPKFKLTVKGFYGQPVAYDLYCSDFRANFNANTGNFGATAKFIGYSFSIMNDLSLTSLLASPYSEYYGEKYWESKISNGTFALDNLTPMPKLIELIEKIDSINSLLNKTKENDELKSLQDKLNLLNGIIDKCSLYANAVYNNIKTNKFSLTSADGLVLIVSGDYSNEQTILFNREAQNLYNDIVKKISEYDDKWLSYMTSYEENVLGNVFCAENIDNSTKSYYYSNLSDEEIRNVQSYKFVHEFDWSTLASKIQKEVTSVSSKITDKEKDIAREIKESIYATLGFHPSVENITNIILAHVDTFLHELYHCAQSVSSYAKTNRQVNGYRTEKDITTYGADSSIMYAFPEVVEKYERNGVKQTEKSWVGKFDTEAPETKLVESLLKATKRIESILTKSEENADAEIIKGDNEIICEDELNKGTVIPITPFDILGYSEPYLGTDISKIDSLCANIFLRAYTIIMSKDISKHMKDIGKLDSLSFYKNIPLNELNDEFVTLVSPNGTMTPINVINLLKHQNVYTNPLYSEGDKMIWEQGASHNYNEPYLYQPTKYCNTKFFTKDFKQMLQVCPLKGIDWSEFNPKLADLKDKHVITNKFNENLFKIDKDWEKYDFLSQTQELTRISSIDKENNTLFDITKYSSFFKEVIEKGNFHMKSSTKRENSTKINDIAIEISNVIKGYPSFTLTSFNGYIGGNVSNEVSLFAQDEFYKVKTNEGKALLFLNSFFWDIRDFMNEFKKGHFNYMPYYYVLTIGGYLKRAVNKGELTGHQVMFGTEDLEGELKNINAKPSEFLDSRGFFFWQDNLENKLLDLSDGIKNMLITQFENWANSDFQTILSQFSLKISEDNDIESLINSHSSYSSYEEYDHGFLGLKSNYRLINKESAVEKIVVDLFKPCVVLRGTDYYMADDVVTPLTESQLTSYIGGFIEGLRENMPETIKENGTQESTQAEIDEFKTIKEVKVSLYSYLKRIWDKWLAGSGEESNGKILWEYTKFKDRWHYIDSYYNKIGTEASINVLDFKRDIKNAYQQAGYSALSLMSSTYGHSGFNLMCTQSFMSMVTDEKMKDIFKAIPYKDIDFSDVSSVPDFVVVYIYEPSSKLDLGDDQPSDSYMIGGDDVQLPEPIKTKTLMNGYKIPSFGVSVGKLYQSYFSNVSVGMESPQVTEHALQATFDIAEMAQNGKPYTVVGSDLFTVWSNNSYTCTVTMMGCAWVQPLMNFQLNNVPMFKGTYLIQKVSHNISQGQMTTTFVGTRMANVSTPIVKDGLIVSSNDQTGIQANRLLSNQGEYASISNDCKYKYYNPLQQASNAGMSQEELNMTMFDYGLKYGGWKLSGEYLPSEDWQKSHSVLDFLACIIVGEASVLDKLGQQQVCAVIFNRYKASGNLVNVLYNNFQHETRRWSSWDGYSEKIKSKFKDLVEEIFINTPIVLVGSETHVERQVPIWNYKQQSGEMTQSVSTTEHMVKSMNAYDTTLGYDTNYKNPRSEKNIGDNKEPLEPIPSDSYTWHGGEYLCQHDKKGTKMGHVLVSTSIKGAKAGSELWQTVNTTVDDNKNQKPSKFCHNLFESIKKTCDASTNITLQNLQMKEGKKDNYNTMEITCAPSSGMAQIFDIVLNAYFEHVDELYWVVKNSGEENPQYIQVKVGGSSHTKKIAIAQEDLSKTNGVSVINQYEGLNKLFYTSLKKHYGEIDNENAALFSTECPNFTTLVNSSMTNEDGDIIDWKNTVNGYFNTTILSCENTYLSEKPHTIDNKNTSSIFTWTGNDNAANYSSPTQIDSTNLDMDKVVNKLKADVLPSSVGQCAGYVRRALQEGGLEIEGHQPNSACRYVAHLPYWGFDLVYQGTVGGNNSSYVPQKGDIAVIAGVTNEDEKRKHGHIHVYGGDGWYSDFKAQTPHVYANPKGRPFKIFRQRGK